MRIMFFVLFMFFLTLPVKAAEEELAPGYNACTEKAYSTADMIECVTNAYQYWDKKLNENYKKAQETCKGAEKPDECSKKLLKAERLWVQYRDAMADVIFDLEGGGSLSRLAADNFSAEETKKQANLLDSGND